MGLHPGPWKACVIILAALFVAIPAHYRHHPNHPIPNKEELKKKLHELHLDNMFDEHHGVKMGMSDKDCDDGETGIDVDWDPYSTEEIKCTLTEEAHLKLNGDLINKTEAEHKPSIHVCFPDKIDYPDDLPLSGSHRPLWPQFGEYEYPPPQRWVHSLEHGAIAFLYHPCVGDISFTTMLKNLVSGCLWKHVISPYRKIPSNMPYALVSYGHALLFGPGSEWDHGTLEDMTEFFIKTTAHNTSETHVTGDGQYSEGLKHHAQNKNKPNQILC